MNITLQLKQNLAGRYARIDVVVVLAVIDVIVEGLELNPPTIFSAP